MKHKIYGQELNNMPFEPRPEGCDSPLWRYSKNPVISMNPFPNASRVFNSAVMAYKGEFIGIREMRKHVSWYTTGMAGSARFRNEINQMENMESLKEACKKLFLS